MPSFPLIFVIIKLLFALEFSLQICNYQMTLAHINIVHIINILLILLYSWLETHSIYTEMIQFY